MITRAQVEHVASLARLALDEADLDRMTSELSAILGYVDRLQELDTSTIAPTSQLLGVAGGLRDDEAKSGLSRERVLGQGPVTDHDGFAVPAFVDE